MGDYSVQIPAPEGTWGERLDSQGLPQLQLFPGPLPEGWRAVSVR